MTVDLICLTWLAAGPHESGSSTCVPLCSWWWLAAVCGSFQASVFSVRCVHARGFLAPINEICTVKSSLDSEGFSSWPPAPTLSAEKTVSTSSTCSLGYDFCGEEALVMEALLSQAGLWHFFFISLGYNYPMISTFASNNLIRNHITAISAVLCNGNV